MLEAVDQVAQEREPNPALYRMLTGALRTLASGPHPIVTPAFFWKLLSPEGFQPILDTCARCGESRSTSTKVPSTQARRAQFVAFDLDEGGMVCAPAPAAAVARSRRPRWP